MDDRTIIYTKIPKKIKTLLINGEGWLVGGSCNSILNGNIPKDYDIIIPDRELYHRLLIFLGNEEYTMTLNTFGGCKVTIDDIEVDLWCEELSHFLLNANKVNYIFNLKKVMLLKLL